MAAGRHRRGREGTVMVRQRLDLLIMPTSMTFVAFEGVGILDNFVVPQAQ